MSPGNGMELLSCYGREGWVPSGMPREGLIDPCPLFHYAQLLSSISLEVERALSKQVSFLFQMKRLKVTSRNVPLILKLMEHIIVVALNLDELLELLITWIPTPDPSECGLSSWGF